ncbi:MAG: class I SAM-dependent methyltransferase [Thermoanaerobaculia bacterium]
MTRIPAGPTSSGSADPRVAARWDETAQVRAHNHLQGWLDSQLLFGEVFQARISGDPHGNWLEGLMRRGGVPKGGRWASLGCGAAGEEKVAARRGLFAALVGYDASPKSLEIARSSVAAEGLRQLSFAPIDLNDFALPAAAFDVVLMNMSLHHVRELRPALESVRRALAPGGVLILNEFVGPRQFQFPEAQVATVRTLLAALPEALRQDTANGILKREYTVWPVEFWNEVDPSEAIRSDRILPEVERSFDITVRIDYGGTILNLLLENIIHNFDPQNEKDAAILRLLAACEAVLVDGGFLASDFTAILARPLAEARDVPPGGFAPPTRLGEVALASPSGTGAAAQEIAALQAEVATMRSSRGWRLAQALRGLLGRRW